MFKSCSLVVLVATLSVVACDMRGPARSTPWGLNGAGDAGVDTSAVDSGVRSDSRDVGVGDAGSDDDADTADVTGDDSGTHTDVSAGPIETSGWHTSSFENSAFYRTGELELSEDSCAASIKQAEGSEVWWVDGIPLDDVPALRDPTQIRSDRDRMLMGRFRVSGDVSARGQHGHLGGYDRHLTASDYELQRCETFRALGECVVPVAGEACYKDIQQYSGTPPKVRLERHISGSEPSEDRYLYELLIEFDQDVYDSHRELQISLELPVDAAKIRETKRRTTHEWSLADLETIVAKNCMSMGQTGHTYYGRLSGWIRRVENDQGDVALKVNLETKEGTSSDRGSTRCRTAPLGIWGHYDVDEVVEQP